MGLVVRLVMICRCCRTMQDERADLFGQVREKEQADVEANVQNEEREATSRRRILRELLPTLPRDCARFTDQNIYAKPSHMLTDMVANLPANRRLNEDQKIFMLRFGDVLDTVWREEQTLPPERRSVYHMLLLGQGGSGKTYIVQNLIFPVVHFLWPPSVNEDSLMVVAAKNSQAKNISTENVRAMTLHTAGCVGIQEFKNSLMSAGKKKQQLEKRWGKIRVLVIEEISMVSAVLYNMLDYRSMLGRSGAFNVDALTYTKVGCAFGRVPIVLHLGDFLQLSPTAQISLIEDLHRRDEQGQLIHKHVALEVQHAQKLFKQIPDVFELRGTMRFKPQDPLIEILHCMRGGHPMPESLWSQFQERVVRDETPGVVDARLNSDKFRSGYCMSIHWSSLIRMMYRRTVLEARRRKERLVFLQALDTSLELERDTKLRLLNQPNPYNTGMIHGILPCFVGMEIRLLARLDVEQGLVQDTQATIMDFEFHDADRARYLKTEPGEMFVPAYLPSGLWVSVKDYQGCPGWQDLLPFCQKHVTRGDEAEKLARSFYFLKAEEVVWKYSKAEVRRCGFRVTHAQCLTSTASQGLTLRSGTVVDCAREANKDDDDWWLHLYVMFSRVTSLSDLLLLRPPPRELLERGPPAAVAERLKELQERATVCRTGVTQSHRL